MLTDNFLTFFLTLALLYGACCSLCIAFAYCIAYVFSDPSEHIDGRTLAAKLAFLSVVVTVFFVLANAVQRF